MITAVGLMRAHQGRQALMRQRAEEMCQAAQTAAARAEAMYAKAEASYLTAQKMSSGIRRTLETTRANSRRTTAPEPIQAL